jgi:hypothetical protein
MENVTGIPDLSEQVLVSCVGNCNGGSHLDALNYFHNVGVPEESCYPYLATNGNCDDRCASPVFLERVTSANLLWGQQCTAENLKAALQTGPLVVMMKVFTDFDSYPGGVYNYTSGNYRGLHVVNLVGYNDTLECFKAKNSWGPDWGEGGYFRIGYANVSNAVLFGQYAMNVSGPYTQYLIGAAFTIRNLGDDDLSVRRITTDRGWLLYSPAVPPNANLRPGGTRDVVIGVDWGQVTAIQDTATMIFTCDDPDEPTVTVQVVAIQGELPIQLRSFTGRLCSSDLVRLEWSTTSETNNYGFEVQRSSSPASGFTTIAGSFVAGHGTTLALHCYAYTDSTASGVAPYYRLKQIDLDGMLHYTDAIRPGGLTDVGNVPDPTMYALDQNFPNPFNPTTTVSFALPKPEHVTLKVFDLLGREVATLADEQLGAGYHRRMWNAGEMPSGVYFCRLHAGDFAQTRKLVLMK